MPISFLLVKRAKRQNVILLTIMKYSKHLKFFILRILGGSRKRPHPGSSRARTDPSTSRQHAAAPADYRGQQEYGKTHPAAASMQPSSSFHPTEPCYQPGRIGHDTSIDSQYGSSGSMDHPYGDHTHSQSDHHGGPPPLQANYTSSPYLYRDHTGVHNAPPKHHKGGLPSYSDLNRMSPIPEVSYNAPNRTASYSAPKNGPVINLHSTNSYRDHHRQTSDTVV